MENTFTLPSTLIFIFIGYGILALIFMAIEEGVNRFFDNFSYEWTTCVKIKNKIAFLFSSILLSVYLTSAFWVLFTQIDKESNMQEVGLIFGIMFLIFFISVVKFDILPNRRKYGRRN